MKLSPPKVITWVIAVILGVLGILGTLTSLPFASDNAFVLVALGFVLLALATLIDGL
jgi:uncharacterized membrane protein